MTNYVHIAGSNIGDGWPACINMDIGINHQGNVEVAKKLIDVACDVGCNMVKFQTRTIEIVYSAEELARPRESPFGQTNEALKRGLELSIEEYAEIDEYCKLKNMTWTTSLWDEASVDRMAQFDLPCFKIASACLTDDNLLKRHLQYKKPIILSTGMSTLRQIDHAVEILGTDNLIILHCIATYPTEGKYLNLSVMNTLRRRYGVPVGWSGHELGLATTVAAVAMGAVMVERHGCLNRADWGSDMAASVEPQGFQRLVRDIREVERARGDGVKRVLPQEVEVAKKLRRVDIARLEG